MNDYAVGSLVRARGREWVVRPDSSDDVLMLRPLGGTEAEVMGLYLPIEDVEPARFEAPTADDLGDFLSARLLRSAVRLGVRSSAGPFRSLGHIAVEPRTYQYVPLLMALKLDPVRLLIADDVGIGKTIEACLVAKELLDRHEARRLAVLCPPHLAEQWQGELREKFHINAALVLPGTVRRLESDLSPTESLFDRYPHVIVSLDYIKSDRRRDDFQRACPDLVIVDEAHTCATADRARSAQHQRHALVSELSKDEGRHMILVTATPHSGKEEGFRSLLGLLDRGLLDLPEDLTGPEHEKGRRQLSRYFVQRRRADIRSYLDEDTEFRGRDNAEHTYRLHTRYADLLNRALAWAEEVVSEPGEPHRQRVRWWAALGLLRALVSSPAAAADTLRSRAASAETRTVAEADEVGRRQVLDVIGDENPEGMDVSPGALLGEGDEEDPRGRRRLLEMARAADELRGPEIDHKLREGIGIVEQLVADDYNPIIFCRFIATADYVGKAFRDALPGSVDVRVVTGTLPPEEREHVLEDMEGSSRRVLVATDCLSEGMNLQKLFDAVVHYDLSWNPTRHEQREGRVDRFGQATPHEKVRVVTFYGIDNKIDGIVLEVLIRKHKAIRQTTGVSVPVPAGSDQVIEAVLEGLVLREHAGRAGREQLAFDAILAEEKQTLHLEWDDAAEQERRSQTMFAQERLRPEEVAREVIASRSAVGGPKDVAHFMEDALRAYGAEVVSNGRFLAKLGHASRAVREVIGTREIVARFEEPAAPGEVVLTRTHPYVEGLASHVVQAALDGEWDAIAARSGVIETSVVAERTVLLLVRTRHHIVIDGDEPDELLAEEMTTSAFRGSLGAPEWLGEEEAAELLDAEPEANVAADRAATMIRDVREHLPAIEEALSDQATERGQRLLEAHRRVREAAHARKPRQRIEPHVPPDIIGLYVLLPRIAL